MSETIIKVENLSKRYRIGLKEQKADTFAQQMVNALKYPIKNFQQIRSLGKFKENQEGIHWALKDVSFEVKRGEVLGIIGKNGAGKSTLLKILSRITEPTSGRVEIDGRIAALLEVGTGFHPELTGRENIYMNGTILGMTKKEIDRKLDEIINFSGIEKFVDTPIKFYSSGMKVRLGFSVAAHLDPEILVIDEVLAVGDIEFQKKCLGKMEDVSKNQGRTVLFVSHNMGAVQNLCSRCILLRNGEIIRDGSALEAVEYYSIKSFEDIKGNILSERTYLKQPVVFKGAYFLNDQENEVLNLNSGQKATLRLEIFNNTEETFKNVSVGVGIFTLTETMLVALKSDLLEKYYTINPGLNVISCVIDKIPLSKGTYKFNLILNKGPEILDWIKDAGFFEVESGIFFSSGKTPAANNQTVLVMHNWL
jgi:lipopolysaccharide transport system ATP-binding protein